MKQFDIALAARAFSDGRAKRTALLRHRRLVKRPLALVFWQLGAEPFSAAAIGFGQKESDLRMIVAGDPRNRDLAFASLRKFADWFNPLFEAPADERTTIQHGEYSQSIAKSAPQILVANFATVEMIDRLGRRLAYLPMDGPQAAPFELVRLGQHFQFIARHARVPGQQLVIALTELLSDNWMTSQSAMERLSLAALNAFIEPPPGIHGFHAAAAVEKQAVGPLPSGEDDERLDALVSKFNAIRKSSTDPNVIAPLLRPIRDHYEPLVKWTWNLLWECRNREIAYPEAPSVKRRWDSDCAAYTQHIDWIAQSGRRRTRQTPRQAAMLLRRLEDAGALLQAEEACDDSLRMLPYLLDGKAIQGTVVRTDINYREIGRVRLVRRPLVTIRTLDPCLMPCGKELWWTRNPGDCSYAIRDVKPSAQAGSLVTLKLNTSTLGSFPRVGDMCCFSIHKTSTQWFIKLPPQEPWTHRPVSPVPGPESIEEGV